jgi:hypothetical protein
MGFFPLFLSTILLPLITIALLWRRARRPASGWLATLVLASGVTGFSVLAAPWGFFGVPLRLVIATLFAIAVLISVRRPIPKEQMSESPVRHLVKIVIGLFFGGVAFGVIAAHATPGNAIDLQFPLRGGSFLIAHGGSEPAANLYAADKARRYALDIMKLNAFGTRARGFYPDELTRYAIWGAPVVSPCDGTVLRVIDGVPDNRPGVRDEKRKDGNHVVIRCGDADVVLAHLQQGSIVVKPNAAVIAGAPVARVGSSGDAAEPHLHVYASRGGIAVPARFDRRWLVRNAVVRR